jgi:hypothetical protein
MLCHQRLNDLLPPLLEHCQRSGFVLLHEATVADHIGSQNSSEATFHDG